MTPAVSTAKNLKLDFCLHEYEHDPNIDSYGLEASEKLGVNPAQVFKTLVVQDEHGKLAVACVPVQHLLNLKKIAKALGCKKVQMAEPKLVERTTGYVLGGVSPLGQKKRLPTVIDETAKNFGTIFCSAGRRGLEIELSPVALATAVGGSFADILQE
ncbi:Cys-tRNA(Pro) deacylase [Faucicola boevrei]|uniref:Cys-tRNA(Pro) deacylase n=1 Tax=Faucicola boevrei TaxID=346665 RepID=UPI000378DDA2|nr:Cys-tRNA(Pro) deacylase [Moraxella boevrei]